jgi:hypothetical protein
MADHDDHPSEWKRGYKAGVRKTKSDIWNAVYEYVHKHSPAKADALKEAIVQAVKSQLEGP